ncbi:MAG: pseudouridine synthase [Proteobacteria bacterium]|nr:pseudouridine synthase [Pseudomonadota bacterium]
MRRLTSPTHPYQDDTRGLRIQKVLADAGMGSRRNCETAVEEGRVTVNGHRIDGLPAWVNAAEDDIRMDGRRIKPTERDVYVMLFKPKGYLSTNSDPEGRALAVDLVQHPSHARLFPVGRLDAESSGLLLMTNDGALANRLTHPRFEMAKGYEVMVNGRVNDEDVERLERGIFVPGKQAGEGARAGGKLVILKRDTGRTLLYMELRESRNRDIRNVLAALGHPIKKLRRVRMGPLQLKSLQAGEWRELTPKELAVLREHAFATPQERAARRDEPVATPRKPRLRDTSTERAPRRASAAPVVRKAASSTGRPVRTRRSEESTSGARTPRPTGGRPSRTRRGDESSPGGRAPRSGAGAGYHGKSADRGGKSPRAGARGGSRAAGRGDSRGASRGPARGGSRGGAPRSAGKKSRTR